jgi:hypothetical protein
VRPEPIRRYSALVTSADALAWERLPSDGRRRDLWLMIGLAVVAGVGLGMLPEPWTEGWRFYVVGLSFCVLGYCCWMAIRTLDDYLRARRRIPGPMEIAVSQWGDHFEVSADGRTRYLAREAIGAVVATDTHLFIASADDLIILPVSAFESVEDMKSTARALEDQLRDPD